MKGKITYSKKCRCVETGQTWSTQIDCAKAIGVSSSKIYESIRFQEPINGLHYIHL